MFCLYFVLVRKLDHPLMSVVSFVRTAGIMRKVLNSRGRKAALLKWIRSCMLYALCSSTHPLACGMFMKGGSGRASLVWVS